jgi:hypothetical protein
VPMLPVPMMATLVFVIAFLRARRCVSHDDDRGAGARASSAFQ